jgi:hypothetical protein
MGRRSAKVKLRQIESHLVTTPYLLSSSRAAENTHVTNVYKLHPRWGSGWVCLLRNTLKTIQTMRQADEHTVKLLAELSHF